MVRVYHPGPKHASTRFSAGLTDQVLRHRLPCPGAASYNSEHQTERPGQMAVYVRFVEPTVGGTASKEGHIEQVYSPDHATAFTYDDAEFYRQKAFERWSNYDWEIEKLGGDKYRVRARRLATS